MPARKRASKTNKKSNSCVFDGVFENSTQIFTPRNELTLSCAGRVICTFKSNRDNTFDAWVRVVTLQREVLRLEAKQAGNYRASHMVGMGTHLTCELTKPV